jgi:hypothetical protein
LQVIFCGHPKHLSSLICSPMVKDNLIRFDKAQGIMGIFAPNASGKSSMWDALSFVSMIKLLVLMF